MKTLLNRNNLIFDPPPADCVLYLPGLPGGGTIQDRSPWGNHVSITGAVWNRLSNGLWYLSFDGYDDYAAITDNDSLDFGGESFSIRLWLYLLGTDGDLIGKYYSAQPGRWGFSIRSASIIRFYTVAGALELTVDNLTDKWQSLTFIINREDEKAYLYQQGCLKNSASFTPQTFSNSIDLTIGKYSSAQWGNLQCYVTLYSIHKRILSALEIQNAFNQEKHQFGVWQK